MDRENDGGSERERGLRREKNIYSEGDRGVSEGRMEREGCKEREIQGRCTFGAFTLCEVSLGSERYYTIKCIVCNYYNHG